MKIDNFNSDVRSPSNVKRHIRIEAVHYDVCRKQYEKISLNAVSFEISGLKNEKFKYKKLFAEFSNVCGRQRWIKSMSG